MLKNFFSIIFKHLKKINEVLQSVFYVMLGFLCIVCINVMIENSTEKKNDDENLMYAKDLYVQKLELEYNASKNALIDSIDAYIKSIAPYSNMNGLSFVNDCEEYNVDLFFVLAQCQIESKFATTGLGAKTNSAFNIKAYDGHGDKFMSKYKHPDLSIKPYLKIITTTYLDDDTTELHLLQNYVNLNGNRYATDEKYEEKLLYTYNKISTKLDNVYNQYKRYKMLIK